MSGIYIHIPFCRQRCHYCDFYTTTQLKRKPELVEALVRELTLRKSVLQQNSINTIYFGGGTPSLLTVDEITEIIATIYKNYQVAKNPEITFEANPDDLSEKQLELLAQTKINRLSIGIQSFISANLQLMNRRHQAQQAIDAVKNAQQTGFKNISIDLIYGLPNFSMDAWKYNLEQVEKLNVQHVSAYHLTYEKGTVFDVKRRKGVLQETREEESIAQFKYLISWAKKHNFIHYEISNFGKENFFSEHNSNYWNQQKYLGVGPSAHSYFIDTRSWNPSNLSIYINGVMENKAIIEVENLSDVDKFNELIITSLRTRNGLNIDLVEKQFGNQLKHHVLHMAEKFIENKKMYVKNNQLIFTDSGVFISDAIMAELMLSSDHLNVD